MEAVRQGAAEALMLNDLGNVAECTGDNIFIVKDGTVFTPPVTDGCLDGITRRVVLEICRELQIPAQEKTMNRFTITCADECFLTGTAAECVPVTKLDGYQLGSGKSVLSQLESWPVSRNWPRPREHPVRISQPFFGPTKTAPPDDGAVFCAIPLNIKKKAQVSTFPRGYTAVSSGNEGL